VSVDIKQTIAQASLNNLHDITVPERVGFFPMAPGWYVVLLLLLTLLFHFGYSYYKAYKKEQYRRDAKKELETLNDKNRENAIALLALAKKVGITAYGRAVVVPLQGDNWWDFIASHSKAKVDPKLRVLIVTLLYEEDVIFDAATFDAIVLVLLQWIKTHKRISDV